MTFSEAYAMLGREFVRQTAQQMVVIEHVQTWSPQEKELQKRLLIESACDTWKRQAWATTTHFLNQNRRSQHDFSDEVNGKPAAASVLKPNQLANNQNLNYE